MSATNASNSSMPTNAPEICYLLDKSETIMVFKVIGYVVVMILSAFGNIFVIVLVVRTKRPRGVMDVFILNMAFSDLSVPFLVAPKQLYEIITNTDGLWQIGGPVGDALCKICSFITGVSSIVSILTLCLITLERFLSVVRPNVSLTKKKNVHYITSIMTWVISIAVCGIYFKTFRVTVKYDNKLECEIYFEDETVHKAYIMILFILFVLLPFFMMACMYTFLFVALRRSYIRMKISLSLRAQRRRIIKMWAIFKLSASVVLGFAVCWGPMNIGVFLLTFTWGWHYTSECTFKGYWYVAYFISTSNAAINPWIYLLFVERFKKELRTSFKKSITLLNISANSNRTRSTSVHDS